MIWRRYKVVKKCVEAQNSIFKSFKFLNTILPFLLRNLNFSLLSRIYWYCEKLLKGQPSNVWYQYFRKQTINRSILYYYKNRKTILGQGDFLRFLKSNNIVGFIKFYQSGPWESYCLKTYNTYLTKVFRTKPPNSCPQKQIGENFFY